MESRDSPAPGQEGRRTSPTPQPPENINLAVLSPNADQIPNGRIVLPDLPLATTLRQLRERICQEVPSRPQPDRQRLIYRGRALLDANATLLEVFSSELPTAEAQPSFTIHLVLPPPNASSSHQPSRSSSAPPQQAQNPSNNPPHGAPQVPPMPGPMHNGPSIAQLQAQQHMANEIMRSQLEMMQRMNQAFMPQNAFVQQGGGVFHPPGQHFPNLFSMPHPPGIPQVQQGPQSRQNMPHQFSNPPSGQGQPNSAAMSTAQNPNLPQQSDHLLNAMRDGSGRTQLNQTNGGATGTPQQPTPFMSEQRPASERPGHQPSGQLPPMQNGSMPSHTTVQESIGPNGERMRTVISNQSFNIQMQARTSTPPFQHTGSSPHPNVSRSNTPHRSADTSTNGPPNAGAQQGRPAPNFFNPMMNPSAPSGLPPPPMFPPFPMSHPGLPFHQAVPHSAMHTQTSSNTTTAWLLSGPSGPQGFLLSPEHGFFSSPSNTNATNLNARAAAMRPFMHSRRVRPHTAQQQQPAGRTAQPQHQIQAQQAGQPQNPPAEGAVRAPLVQLQNAQQGQQQQQVNQAERNIFQLARERAWLFVRLYLFIFIFGGHNGWLRWFWLAATVIWCLIPENTILQDLWRSFQRHIEELLPLAPTREQREEQQALREIEVAEQLLRSQNPNTANATTTATPSTNTGNNETQPQVSAHQQSSSSSNGNATRQRTPTPEEAAERIRREHRARQANWFADTLTRVERGAVLFLASLIPGIGERHIEHRNEIAERERREEEERRRREDEERERGQTEEAAAGGSGSGVGGGVGDGVGNGVGNTTAERESTEEKTETIPPPASNDEPKATSSAIEGPGDAAAGTDGVRQRAAEAVGTGIDV